MRQLFIFILVCCSLACSSPGKIPDDIMGINEMKPIVWDMIRAGVLTQNQYRSDTLMLRKEMYTNYEQVFNIHHTTKDEFYKSYRYYLEHPDKHKVLMDTVIAYANRKRIDLFKRVE